MFRMKWISGLLMAASAVLLVPTAEAQLGPTTAGAPASTRLQTTPGQDELFASLRDAARRDDVLKTTDLAARLRDYPVPSYIEYFSLKPRIRIAPESEIRDYLARYDGEAIADRLRNDWLLELGRNRNWVLFDEQYPRFALDDDLQLKCYALMSRADKKQDVASDARVVLSSPKDYGEACPALIDALMQNGQFGAEDLWFQVRLAVEVGAGNVARRIAAIGNVSDRLVMQAIDSPAKTIAGGIGASTITHQLFIVALGRIARSSPDQAGAALARESAGLSALEQAQGWAQIALQAALKLAPDAVDYWRKAGPIDLSLDAYQWRVRSALRRGEWTMVKVWIGAMPASLGQDPTWIYWNGRALKAEGKLEEANENFRSIASQTQFYGQLALEELGQKIVIPPRAAAVTPDEMAPVVTNAGFARALKFIDLNMRWEGYREWNWQLRKMNDRQILAAAEYARQNNVLDRMVNTSDRTRAEFDFTQRFPAPFADVMHAATRAVGLDKAWAYGLIRQESRFIMAARSNVGASGLMQIMPGTAREVARRIGLTGFHAGMVNDIQTNILLGTNYLSMVLNALDGSQALATAAYNAGPGRPRTWRSTLIRPVEGAIFAETIPFNETRGYVKNVLSNATYYAAMFENSPQSLKRRLGMVSPASAPAGDSAEPFQ
ncbi:MAG: lytic transglycosylase protein [Herminiimonas sp.]|nr:lytic transglycosylase protein [Herminiimonas sp.]